ncbi:MAG: hypothetical protein R3B70_02500 [Polyangiaceae bacterium]
MRASLLSWSTALLVASAAALGCNNTVSVEPTGTTTGGNDCEDPPPEVPPGTYCPPAYVCIDGEWVDTAGACPEPECPLFKPDDGDACQLVGQTCPYEEEIPCGPIEQVNAVCTENGWISMYPKCQPEPECPDEMPIAGADCAGWDYAYDCYYQLEAMCGSKAVSFTCVFTENEQVWLVQSGETCGPCKDHGSEAECALDAECQWLTPGCGPEPIQTGCYPKTGCDLTDCPTDDSICVETTYNPCYNQLCDACGASFFACLPAWSP